METKYPKKLNYKEYEHAFSYALLLSFTKRHLYGFDTERMRGLVYGYTFTEDYAKGVIPDQLSIEYWKEKNKNRFANVSKNIRYDAFSALSLSEFIGQEGLIYEAIESTGNGTLENPYCVICVKQEYEFLRSHRPTMKVVSQSLLPGHIDRMVLEEESGYSETIHFDINRWFERNTNSCK